MKNITLSADSKLIDKARRKAKREKTSLNKKFREWLENYTRSVEKSDRDSFWQRYANLDLRGPMLTREQLNER